MTTFTCPSDTFPALPAVQIDAPDDWEPVPSAGAALAVRAGRESEHPGPNVVITLHRYLAGFSLDQALTGLRAELGKYEQNRIDEPFHATFGTDTYVVVNTALAHPTFGYLVQVHAYTSFLVGDGLKDVVHVVGTCAGSEVSRDYPLLQQVMESTRVAQADALASTSA